MAAEEVNAGRKTAHMDERQMTVCAIALFADGYSARQVGEALGVDAERARKLISAEALTPP